MVKATDSIQFDVERAQRLADAHGWDTKEWARRADVSVPTLREWLRGSGYIKLRSIDKILKPLGLTADELLIRSDKK